MSAQNNIKPLVDGILQNPLEFKPASKHTSLKSVSSETLKNPAFIIISSSAKQAAKSEESRGESQDRARERDRDRERKSKEKVPKSMAEAIALYSQPTAATVVRDKAGEDGSRVMPDVDSVGEVHRDSRIVTNEDDEKGGKKGGKITVVGP